MDKDFYNSASATKLGWEPIWFDAMDFDDSLVEKIKRFQKEHDLDVDGLCGPLTYRRVVTSRQAAMELALEKYSEKINNIDEGSRIICAGKGVDIAWNKVVNLVAENNLALPSSCFRLHAEERKPTMIVTHWDAALSAKSCYNILKKRGISSHFVIDNDGTIYQMVDTQHIGWHAGNKKVNQASIGIDFSNAYYMKYQKYYEKRGFGPRPVLSDSTVHGRKLKDHLGYYPEQIAAYKALLKCLHTRYGIPLKSPITGNGVPLNAIHTMSKSGKYEGVVCHYHLTNKKIDCAGLPLEEILDEIRN
tara:strand:+ start:2101 stop:3012 length:912 start_codon:yes stop_codon:yes gene_type:complete